MGAAAEAFLRRLVRAYAGALVLDADALRPAVVAAARRAAPLPGRPAPVPARRPDRRPGWPAWPLAATLLLAALPWLPLRFGKRSVGEFKVRIQPGADHLVVRLGETLLEAGLPVSAYIGKGQLDYRMYPGGLGDMVVGFDKNFATAAGEVRWPWMLAMLLWLSGLFWAAWCLPAALLGWPLVGTHAIGPNALIYGAFAVQLLLLSRRVGRFHWINLIFPIPVLFFLGVFILAIFKLERGHVEWKGRRFKAR